MSQGCAARITSPLKPGGHAYRIAPTWSFYQLKLASCPAKVVEAAHDRALYDMYDANLGLRKLNYRDVAYYPLDTLFNQAATEYQKGEFYRFNAMEISLEVDRPIHDSVNLCAKAVRCFTRCQAFAKQVYQSLVPPPDTPEDLGLEPYGYWSKEP